MTLHDGPQTSWEVPEIAWYENNIGVAALTNERLQGFGRVFSI